MIAQTELKSIVVAWKFAAQSELALQEALNRAGDSTVVHVVHVAPLVTGPDNGAMFLLQEHEIRRSNRRRFLDELPNHLRDERVRFSTEFGAVGPELVRFGKRVDVDLAILTDSKRSRLGRILSGNNIGYVTKHSSCPVHVVTASDQTLDAQSSDVRSFAS